MTASGAYVANFEAIPQYTITIAPDDVEHGTVAFGGEGSKATLVYDFEDGWQGWTTFQGSTTSPHSWMHNTAYPTDNNDFSTGYGYNNSDGFMLSESYISGTSSGAGTAVTPDNYLVSPQVRLGGSISFYAGARNTSYCAEKFSVMVSTTGNTNPASFTTVATWTLSLSSAGYNSTPYTVDLSAYSGMGYVAIRHFDCYDQWFLCVDNVTIEEGEVNDGSATATFYAGESCTVVATPNTDYAFAEWTENGTTASSSASYTFTVTGDRDLVANFSQTLVVPCPDPTEFSATACESYDWNGETYTVSGDYVQTFTNVNGCDSVVTLHLTVNHGTHNAETATAHESYVWNGETYTETGTYLFNYENGEGCESTDTLHLTVTHCNPITLDAETGRWEEDFEGYTTSVAAETGEEPDCWELADSYVSLSETTKPQLYRGYATSGSYTLRLKNRCVYAMPSLSEDIDISKLKMTFQLRQPQPFYRLQVGLLNAEGEFELLEEINNSGTGMTEVTVDFSGYTGSGRRIAFKNILRNAANYDYSYNYIDDIVLEYKSLSCVISEEQLPYSEDFEGYTSVSVAETGVEPDCWEVSDSCVALTGSTKPQLYRGYATSGSYTLRMKNRCVYSMPSLSEEIDISRLRMTFQLRQPKSFYRLQVGVLDGQGNFELVEEINNSGTGMTEVTVDFTGYTGSGRRIAFTNILRNAANYDYSYNYIDDIELTLVTSKSENVSNSTAFDADAMDSYLDNITVYPNPTTGVLHIDAMDVQKVECYSQMGQLVGVYENVNELNIGELAKGVYMLRITVPQGVPMRKVVKR